MTHKNIIWSPIFYFILLLVIFFCKNTFPIQLYTSFFVFNWKHFSKSEITIFNYSYTNAIFRYYAFGQKIFSPILFLYANEIYNNRSFVFIWNLPNALLLAKMSNTVKTNIKILKHKNIFFYSYFRSKYKLISFQNGKKFLFSLEKFKNIIKYCYFKTYVNMKDKMYLYFRNCGLLAKKL